MVVDTMVFSYALLGIAGVRDEAVRVVDAVIYIRVPDSFRAELGNVVWQWVKHREICRKTQKFFRK